MNDVLTTPDGEILGSGYGLTLDMTAAFVFWSLIQVYFAYYPDLKSYKMPSNTEYDFRNRCVSFIHGLVALALSTYQVLFIPRVCGEPTSPFVYWTLVNSGGYFLYDILGMWAFGLLEKDMLLHHCMCAGGIVGMLLSGTDASCVVVGLFLAEVSNPPMHMRMMLRNLGYRYTMAYEYAEYCYFVVFFMGRLVWGQPIVYGIVMQCDSIHWIGKLVALGVQLQSYQFLYRMYFIFCARLAEQSERSKNQIKIGFLTPIRQNDLEKCQFYKKNKKTRELLP